MSGDVQPRKRKEKRRKKEDSEEIAGNFSVDEHIHIHKDASTGGNICAKILFFLLSFVLLLMVGLVLFEYRGFSDDEALVSVSKWASTFDGWLDETPAKHVDHAKEDNGEHGHAESVEQSGETVMPQRKSDSVHQQSKEVGSGEEADMKKREFIKEVKEKSQHLEDSDIVPAEERAEVNNEKQDKLAARSCQEPVIQDVVTERPTLTKRKDAQKTADVNKETSSGQTTKSSSSTIKQQKPREEVTAAPAVQQSKKQTMDSESPKVENTVSDGRGSSPSKVETSHRIDSKTKDTSKTTDTSKIQGSPKPARHAASDMKEDGSQSSIKESAVTKHDSKITKEDRKLEQDKEVKKGSENQASESENIGASAPGGVKKISKNLEEDKTKKHKESKQKSGSHASESETSSNAPPSEKKVSKSSKEDRKHEQRKELDKNPQNRASGPEKSGGTDPAEVKELNKNLKDGKKPEQNKELKEKSENHTSESGTSGPTAPGRDNEVSKNSKATVQETKKVVTIDSAKKTQYQQKGDTSSQNKAQPTTDKTVDKQTSTSKIEKRHVKDSQASEELGKKVTESSLPKIKAQKPVDSVHHENKSLMKQKEKEMKVVEKPEETKPVNQEQTDTNVGSQSPTELHSSHKDYSKITKTAKKLDEAKPRTPTKKVGDEISNVKTSENKVVEEEENDEPEPSGVALKFGVGVALVIVAHVVLVRKWNSDDNIASPEASNMVQSEPQHETPQAPKLVPQITVEQETEKESEEMGYVPSDYITRRQTLLPEDLVHGSSHRELEETDSSVPSEEEVDDDQEELVFKQNVYKAENAFKLSQRDEKPFSVEKSYKQQSFEELMKKYHELTPEGSESESEEEQDDEQEDDEQEDEEEEEEEDDDYGDRELNEDELVDEDDLDNEDEDSEEEDILQNKLLETKTITHPEAESKTPAKTEQKMKQASVGNAGKQQELLDDDEVGQLQQEEGDEDDEEEEEPASEDESFNEKFRQYEFSKSRQPEKGTEDSGSEKEVPVAKSKIPKNMGGQNAQVYSKADITNDDDWKISQDLDTADDDAEEGLNF